MTDDEIRRNVLARANWTPDQIDRWLAAHPEPSALTEQLAIFEARVRDLGRVMWDEREVFVVLYVAVALCLVAFILLY